MREIININNDWYYEEGIKEFDKSKMKKINLPHSINNEYIESFKRTIVTYCKELDVKNDYEEVYLEFLGSAQKTEVYLNDLLIYTHLGGYQRFRVNITTYLQINNILMVRTFNQNDRTYYPMRADFSFYNGIYRDVNLIYLSKNHFDLDYYTSNGIKITPYVNGDVLIESFFNSKIKDNIELIVKDKDNRLIYNNVFHFAGNRFVKKIHLNNIILWDGYNNPYLYNITLKISSDMVSTNFGFRSYQIDSDNGFILNNKEYPLFGVSMHQDIEGTGPIKSNSQLEEDLLLIKNMGANSIRVSHYLHNPYILDLADQMGLTLYVEIPYITEHMYEAKSNTITLLKELITECYNHPSVILYGLSNEITVVGGESRDLLFNHKKLNKIAHKLDSTRKTSIANVFILDSSSKILDIADVVGYNVYYGWYTGKVEDNDSFFDNLHQRKKNTPLAITEYGADANIKYQNINPLQGDYSESYQALYHEHMLKIRLERKYIFANYVWNMFDFSACDRCEGGTIGLNQKGLVCYDHKTLKDAYYLYKAFLTNDHFVHICNKRYINRNEHNTIIKVYTNLNKIKLYVDNKLVEEVNVEHIHSFEIKISAKHHIKVEGIDASDEFDLIYVDKKDQSYVCENTMQVSNWFDDLSLKQLDGYYSVFDKVKDLKKNSECLIIYQDLMKSLMEKIGDVAKNVKIPKILEKKLDNMTLEENLKMAGHFVTPDTIIEVNNKLNLIKK